MPSTNTTDKRSTIRWYESLRFSFLSLFLLLLMAFVGLFLVMHLTLGREAAQEQGKQSSLIASKNVATSLRLAIQQFESTAHSLAQQPFLAPTLSEEVMSQRMYHLLTNSPQFDLISGGSFWPQPGTELTQRYPKGIHWRKDVDGTLKKIESGFVAGITGYQNEPWYTGAGFYSENRGFWSAVYADLYTGKSILTYATPLYSGEDLLGVFSLDIPLSSIGKLIPPLSDAVEGYAFLLDRTNQLLSFPDPRLISNQAAIQSGSGLVERVPFLSLGTSIPAYDSLVDNLEVTNASLAALGQKQTKTTQIVRSRVNQGNHPLDAKNIQLIAAMVGDQTGIAQKVELAPTQLTIKDDPVLDETAIATVLHLPDTFWKLIVVTPESQFYLAADHFARVVLNSMLIAAGVVVVVFGLVLNRKILRPIRALLADPKLSDQEEFHLEKKTLRGEMGLLVMEMVRRRRQLRLAKKELALLQQEHKKELFPARALFEQCPTGLALYSTKGVLLDANAAFSHLLGYSTDQLKQAPFWKITPKKYEEQEKHFVEKLKQQHQAGPYEKEFQHQNGHLIPITIRGVLLEKESEQFILISVEDLSRHKADEQRIAEKLEAQFMESQLEHSLDSRPTDKAVTESKANCQFLANMSHEIRTSLNAILGYTQIFSMDEQLSERQLKGINIITESGQHLLQLVNDILDLAKLEAGNLNLVPQTTELLPFLTDIAASAESKAEQKALSFRYDFEEQLPSVVYVDEDRLYQVLTSLVSNAVKLSHRGEVSFFVQVRNSTRETVQLSFEVSSEDIGITESELKNLFSPFEQIGETERRGDTTRLSLAVARQLVRLMGGEIQVHCSLDRNCSFYFSLSLATSDSVEESTPRLVHRPVGYQGNEKRILVVDDVAANRSLLIDMLKPLGFEIREAGDGMKALEEAVSWKPDLILMDLIMPIMGGQEATRLIRVNPESKDIPVLIISATGNPKDEDASFMAGAQRFLSKPFEQEALLQHISDLLELEWSYRTSSIPEGNNQRAD